MISIDIVESTPETLLATTNSIFPHFGVLPNCFIQGWEDLVLGAGDGQVTNISDGVGGGRGKFDMRNIAASKICSQQQHNPLFRLKKMYSK